MRLIAVNGVSAVPTSACAMVAGLKAGKGCGADIEDEGCGPGPAGKGCGADIADED